MQDKSGLPTEFQSFIHKSRYARYLWEAGRRETWDETVDRYLSYMVNRAEFRHGWAMPEPLYNELRDAIYNLELCPLCEL